MAEIKVVLSVRQKECIDTDDNTRNSFCLVRILCKNATPDEMIVALVNKILELTQYS